MDSARTISNLAQNARAYLPQCDEYIVVLNAKASVAQDCLCCPFQLAMPAFCGRLLFADASLVEIPQKYILCANVRIFMCFCPRVRCGNLQHLQRKQEWTKMPQGKPDVQQCTHSWKLFYTSSSPSFESMHVNSSAFLEPNVKFIQWCMSGQCSMPLLSDYYGAACRYTCTLLTMKMQSFRCG